MLAEDTQIIDGDVALSICLVCKIMICFLAVDDRPGLFLILVLFCAFYTEAGYSRTQRERENRICCQFDTRSCRTLPVHFGTNPGSSGLQRTAYFCTSAFWKSLVQWSPVVVAAPALEMSCP